MIKANEDVNLCELLDKTVDKISQIEEILGKELVITSGYRGLDHPIEMRKKSPGEHTEGLAVDVACLTPQDFYDLTAAAIKVDCLRIGISRKNNFIHLGFSSNRPKSIWTY